MGQVLQKLKKPQKPEAEKEQSREGSTSSSSSSTETTEGNPGGQQVTVDDVAREVFASLGMSSKYENSGINSGNILAWSVSPQEKEFHNIEKYIAVGQYQQSAVQIKIHTILRIITKADNYRDFEEPQYQGKLRMMLFHGTTKDTVVSILQNGLVLPKTGKLLFGSGFYFADRVRKSLHYCGGTAEGLEGYLFLCDVLLGNIFETEEAHTSLNAPPDGFDSVKGMGRRIPDNRRNKIIGGCVWPLGETVEDKRSYRNLTWNEYVVYNPAQVQPKFLIKFSIQKRNKN